MSNFGNILKAMQQHFSVGRGGPPWGAAATAAPQAPAAPSTTPVLNQALGAMKPGGPAPVPTATKQA